MKKHFILSLLMVLLFAPGLMALDYDGALNMAKKNNKPVLLYFYTTWCQYCRMMDKKTLSDKEIDAVLKKSFVYQRIDVEKSEDVARLYGINGYPVCWFLEPSGKRIMSAPGYIDQPTFKRVLEYIKDGHYKQTEINDYLKKKR